MQKIFVPAGRTIFSEDDVADYAYLVQEGWVEIRARSENNIQSLSLIGPGELFGEMGLITGAPRSASAVAKEDCRLGRISPDQLKVLLDGAEPFHAELLAKLVTRFRATQKAFLQGSQKIRAETSELGPGYAMLASHGDITEALERGEIEPFFQPHMDMTTGGWIGFEALARWRNQQSGMVQPSQFLPLAERTGLIRHIDLAIADRSMAICQAIPGERRPYLNLNFSAWHFRDENLVQRIAKLLEKHGFAPERLRVELTETLMLDEPDRALRIMTALAELGIKLALDDFGTGFSSLSVLHLMPIDILKIDQSLTLGVLREGRPRTVLKHVIALARDLGMETIVEGVENQVMAEALVELGCHVGQGYHLARPLPAEEATAGWLSRS